MTLRLRRKHPTTARSTSPTTTTSRLAAGPEQLTHLSPAATDGQKSSGDPTKPRYKARAVNFAFRLLADGQRLLLLWLSSVAVLACQVGPPCYAGESPAPNAWHARGIAPRPLADDD